MKNKKEIFKPIIINGEKTNYKISSFGRCVNIKTGKFLKPKITEYKNKKLKQGKNNPYYSYTIYLKNNKHICLAHRLVGIAFIPIPEKYTKEGLTYKDLQVDHINNIRYMNNIDNLQWLTPKENIYKMYMSGNHRVAKGEEHGNTKLTNNQIFKVCELLEENKLTQKQISKFTNVPYKTVNKILKRTDFIAISSIFDFSGYNKFEKSIAIDDKIIHNALNLLSTGKYSIKEVSNMLNINNNSLKSIVQCKSRKNIRKLYNLTKFYERKNNIIKERSTTRES